MLETKYEKLALGEILPLGWLKDQLKVQGEGLTGNVMELFRDLSLDSAWLLGNGECWERGPYYLDGLMPLAYLLNDENLKKKAMIWIDSILDSQNSEGFFGPKKNLDWWPRMVITKMLPDYFEVSKDVRVIPFLKKYYSYMNKKIDERPFFSWASVRAIEELIGIRWLYTKTAEKELLELVEKIFKYRFDWTQEFNNFRWAKASKTYYPSLRFNIKKVMFYAPDFIRNFLGYKERSKEKTIKRENKRFNQFYHCTHGVNLAMALKYPVFEGFFKNQLYMNDVSKKGYNTIMAENGNSIDLFTCDEHLSGPEAFQGTELCTVVESMYSAEKLYEITGDRFWADLLEVWAYNALPATFTSDMCAHQYVQQTNQISATVAKRTWYDSYNKANIYGLKPNYACCLSNMHQGFPKFVQNIAYKKDNSIVLLAPLACDISTNLLKGRVGLSIESNYPFNQSATVKVTEGVFDLIIPKPEFIKSIAVNGWRHEEKKICLSLQKGDSVELLYEYVFKVRENPDNSISYYYGPLLMALPIKEKIVIGKSIFSDRQMYPESQWRYALYRNPQNVKVLNREGTSKYPFDQSNISIEVDAKRVNWKVVHNQCDKVRSVGQDRSNSDEKIVLVPYGFTNLRISQFPEI